MENHIKEGNERRLEIISGGMIMDRDEIVCNCMGITAGEIREAIEKGAKTVEDIQEATERVIEYWQIGSSNKFLREMSAFINSITGPVLIY